MSAVPSDLSGPGIVPAWLSVVTEQMACAFLEWMG